MAREIEQYMDRCASQLDPKSKITAWSNGRTAANALFLRGFDKEILTEMKGIAEGAAAAGAKWGDRPVDLVDIVTVNTITELGELRSAMPMTPSGLEGLDLRRPHYDIPKTDVSLTERPVQRFRCLRQGHPRRENGDRACHHVAAHAR